MLEFKAPFQQFFDLNGEALTAGYIYIGAINENPETNPIALYWDAAGTQPAVQPLRTSAGYIVRTGTPAVVYCSEDNYSLTVRDKKLAIIYTSSNVANTSTLQAALASATGASMIGYQQKGELGLLTNVENQLDILSYKNRITLLQNSEGDWELRDQYWNLVDISTSTTHGGQEALDLAFSFAESFACFILGGGSDAILRCSTPIAVPPGKLKYLCVINVTINFTSSNDQLVFDSMNICHVAFLATQVVNNSTAMAIAFKPTSSGSFGPVGIFSSNFYIQLAASQSNSSSGVAGAVVGFDPSVGTFLGSTFVFDKVYQNNNSQTSTAIYVKNPGGGQSFTQNTITCLDIVATKDFLVIGDSDTNQIFGNIWNVGFSGAAAADSVAITTYGRDIFKINGISGTIHTGIKLLGSAKDNLFSGANMNPSVLLDNQSDYPTSNRLVRAATLTQSALTVGASPYTYTNTSLERQQVIVQGGTITGNVSVSDGTTFYDVGVAHGQFTLEPGQALLTTYSVAPTMRLLSYL